MANIVVDPKIEEVVVKNEEIVAPAEKEVEAVQPAVDVKTEEVIAETKNHDIVKRNIEGEDSPITIKGIIRRLKEVKKSKELVSLRYGNNELNLNLKDEVKENYRFRVVSDLSEVAGFISNDKELLELVLN
jgi:hypothetical protein